MNPIIYQNNEFVIVNQAIIPNGQLLNRQLIYIDNNFLFYIYKDNQYLLIQNVSTIQNIIPLIIKFYQGRVTKTMKEDPTPILIQYNKQKKTFKNIRTNDEYGKNNNLMNLMNISISNIQTTPITNLDIKSAQEFHNLLVTEIHSTDTNTFFKCLMTLLLGLYKAINKENIMKLISNTINIRSELIKTISDPKNDLKYHQYLNEIRDQLKIAINNEICIDSNNRILYLELDKYEYVCFDNLLIGLINGINNSDKFLGSLYDQAYKYFTNGKSSAKSENTELTPDCIADLMARMMINEIVTLNNYYQQIKINKPITCIDCTSGLNNLFNSMINIYCNNGINMKFTGIEIEPMYANMANMNNIIYNKNIIIHNTDFFEYYKNINANDVCWPIIEENKTMKLKNLDGIEQKIYSSFDVSIANPPYKYQLTNHYVLEFIINTMMISKIGSFIFPKSAFDKLELFEQLKQIGCIIKIIHIEFQIFQGVGLKDFIICTIGNKQWFTCKNTKIYHLRGSRTEFLNSTPRGEKQDTKFTKLGSDIMNIILNDNESTDNMNEEELKIKIEKVRNEIKKLHKYCDYEITEIKPGEKLKMKELSLNESINWKLEKYYSKENENSEMNLFELMKEGVIVNLRENLEHNMENSWCLDNNELIENECEKIFNEIKKVKECDVNRFRKIKLMDCFEVVRGPSHTIKDAKEVGQYPLIGSSKFNNDNIKYLNTYDYEAGLYSLAKNGSIGYIFKQNIPFNITTDIVVLRKIQNIDDINLYFISLQLNIKFSWANKLNLEKFNDVEIYIYI